MKHAAILDLEQFEDPVFYDKLERARQQTRAERFCFAGLKPGAGSDHHGFFGSRTYYFSIRG